MTFRWKSIAAAVLLTSMSGVKAAGSETSLADAAERMDRAAIRMLLRQHLGQSDSGDEAFSFNR